MDGDDNINDFRDEFRLHGVAANLVYRDKKPLKIMPSGERRPAMRPGCR